MSADCTCENHLHWGFPCSLCGCTADSAVFTSQAARDLPPQWLDAVTEILRDIAGAIRQVGDELHALNRTQGRRWFRCGICGSTNCEGHTERKLAEGPVPESVAYPEPTAGEMAARGMTEVSHAAYEAERRRTLYADRYRRSLHDAETES